MRSGRADSFGMLLRRYRLHATLTQEELSALTGLSVRTISSMEAGRTSRPYRRSVVAIADALCLSDQHRAALMGAARAWLPSAAERGDEHEDARYDEAIARFVRSVAVDPDRPRRGRMLMNLGVIYIELGRIDEGIASLAEGLTLLNEAGDQSGDSLARSLLADAYRRTASNGGAGHGGG